MNFRSALRLRSVFGRVQRFGHGHHGPETPPFARLRPPTEMIHEQTELVWDDSVAPETTIDFDAPHVSTSTVVLSFLSAIGFFAGVMAFVVWSDPVASNPAATRAAVISQESFMFSTGRGGSVDEEE